MAVESNSAPLHRAVPQSRVPLHSIHHHICMQIPSTNGVVDDIAELHGAMRHSHSTLASVFLSPHPIEPTWIGMQVRCALIPDPPPHPHPHPIDIPSTSIDATLSDGSCSSVDSSSSIPPITTIIIIITMMRLREQCIESLPRPPSIHLVPHVTHLTSSHSSPFVFHLPVSSSLSPSCVSCCVG